VNNSSDNKTEQKIIEAAEIVFHEKGFDGARMQEIADKASINKGLLHYYFKSKDALFDAIFNMAIKKMSGSINSILKMDITLEEKINLIIDSYMNLLLRNSSLPRFVITELNKDSDRFIKKYLSGEINNVFANFINSVQEEIDAGKIKPINPKHLFMNMISMILFPFIGKPMIQVLIGVDNKEYSKLIQERRDHIKGFIKDALKP
jgi:TetR/AcrR family transcriptional regulator